MSDSKVEDIFTHNHQSQLIFEFVIITVGPQLATPYSPIMPPDLQTIGHYTPSYVRKAKGGLVFTTFYSAHVPPPSQIGMPGDFYILQDAATVFWKEECWRPWIWETRVKHPSHGEYVLNFDFRGPIWNYDSGSAIQSPFTNVMDATFHFFNVVVKSRSNLGSKAKPIRISG